MVKLKPSNFNSLIINTVESGKLNVNLDLYFSNDFEILNLIAKGNVKEVQAQLSKNLLTIYIYFNFAVEAY